MCEGLEIYKDQKFCKVNFVSPIARLPVLIAESGRIEWVNWGRRKKESGVGPLGGWARLTTIQAGDWDIFEPLQGLVVAKRFNQAVGGSNLQSRRLSQWHDVPKGSAIKCIVIGEGLERRLYIVTTAPPPQHQQISGRWPVVERMEGSVVDNIMIQLFPPG